MGTEEIGCVVVEADAIEGDEIGTPDEILQPGAEKKRQYDLGARVGGQTLTQTQERGRERRVKLDE